jgi:putative addiction module component (TIGR02574 family)
MTKATVDELLRLPAEDRMELAQMLWDSLGPEDPTQLLPIPSWQRALLSERQEDVTRNPGAEQGWEEVEAELWPKR